MKFRAWCVVAALMAFAGVALAQVVANDGASLRGQTSAQAIGGMVRADSTMKMMTMDASGRLQIVDADRDRDLVTVWSDIIPTDSLKAVGDSSSVINVGGAKSLILCIKGCPKGPHGQSVSRVALQFRVHINGIADSVSTMPLYLAAMTNVGVDFTAVNDTVNFKTGHLSAGTANVPWSGEYIVQLDRLRCGPNGSASTTLFYPGGIAIPLDNLFGRGVRLPNLSVRARVIGGPSVLDFTATLIGVGK